MKYKLIDVETHVENGVQFGTCELCSYFGTHHYDVLIFEDENGKRYEEQNGGWCWGDYMENWYIDNYVKFAAFIQDRDYDYGPDRYGNITEIVSHMYVDYQNAYPEEEDE